VLLVQPSQHLRCYTGWGYDSWMPLLGIWFLVVSQKATMGVFGVLLIPRNLKKQDVKSCDSQWHLWQPEILSKKVKGGTHSQRETLGHLLRNEGKQRRFVYIRRLHLLHCCVFLFVKDHKIPVETMMMKCLRCVNGIRLRWLQSSFSKFLKTCVF